METTIVTRKATKADFKEGVELFHPTFPPFTLTRKYCEGSWEAKGASGARIINECDAKFFRVAVETDNNERMVIPRMIGGKHNHSTEQIVKTHLNALINDIRHQAFVNGSAVTNEQVLGVALSKFFDWDVDSLIQTARFAFEDSNYREGIEAMFSLE